MNKQTTAITGSKVVFFSPYEQVLTGIIEVRQSLRGTITVESCDNKIVDVPASVQIDIHEPDSVFNLMEWISRGTRRANSKITL